MPTRVKICCISSIEEAALAVKLGASALGLVSAMPSGPGPIPDALIGEIARTVPPGVATFLLTRRDDPAGVVDQVRCAGVTAVQLVDHVEPTVYARLRAELPNVKIVQVIHVAGEGSIREAEQAAPDVDAILLDSGNPTLAVKELGGTGRRHDWRISRQIRDAVAVPIWLAGGLRPDNVVEAIETVRPFGVDVCSGLRTHGQLDPAKASAFVEAVATCSPG